MSLNILILVMEKYQYYNDSSFKNKNGKSAYSHWDKALKKLDYLVHVKTLYTYIW